VATMVSFHAHPDDETIVTGGVLAKAADEGHRVVLVFATRGEHGEVPEGFLQPGQELAAVRTEEVDRSARILGASRVAFLDYVDSGMMGTPTNDAPRAFWRADPGEAAERLASILREEDARILTIYDANGGYGHPDHIQVHRVGVRAAELAGTARVYEATTSREDVRRGLQSARDAGLPIPGDLNIDDLDDFGVPETTLTTAVDVSPWLDRKRAAMAAHASQITESSFFLAMPPELFARAFGTEWFIRRGAPPGIAEHDLFEGIEG
jgi:LmbE family N-acetylglucosaminyl deacetylase